MNQGKSSVKNTPLLLPFQGFFSSILYPISREVKDKILREFFIFFHFANSYKPSEGPRGDTPIIFSTDILV